MKIYNKIVISIETLEVVEEDSFDYLGPLALCGGGGGPSGAVEYPDFQEKIYADIMAATDDSYGGTPDTINQSMVATMNTALGVGGNPWTSETAYDPSTPLAAMQAEHDSAEAVIDGLDPDGATGTYFDIMTRAKDEVDTVFSLSTEINNAVSTFETNQGFRFRRSAARFAGGMADINSVHSNQFVLGMALIEAEMNQQIDGYEANMRLQFSRIKLEAYLQAANQILTIYNLKTSGSLNLVTLQNEINKAEIAAGVDEVQHQLTIDEHDALWDLQVFQFGANMLASINGAAGGVIPHNPGGLTSSIANVAGATAIGAQIGGPVGAGIGFGVGLLGEIL